MTETENNKKLSKEDVQKVSELAMLNLDESQVEAFTPQLESILDLASELDAFDLDKFEPTAHPFGLQNVFRDDEIERVDVKQGALATAPDVEANQFKVPPALGEER